MAATPKLGKTDQLIADLLANNGRIPVPDRAQDRFERLARTAVRRGKVPAGKEIHVRGRWDTGYHVVLIDEPAWKSVILAPVPVQEALRKPSDVVVQLRDHRVVLVSPDVLNRALRLLDAQVQESRRRGYQVMTWSRPPRLAYESIGNLDGSHLNIEIGHDKYGLSIHQERDKVEHVATKTELARAESGYSYIPKHDEVKTDRLRITIDGQDVAFWRNQWSDRETGPFRRAARADPSRA